MKIRFYKFFALQSGMLLCVIIFVVSITFAQTVISRARIGGYAEDIAFIASGPLKDRIAFLDGYEIYTVPIGKKSQGPFTKLCGIKIPEFDSQPTGLAYIESEGLFVVDYRFEPTKLFLFDQACVFRGTRPIQYLESAYRPEHMEGLAYIPASSPTFPDHLIMVVYDDINAGPLRLEILKRDGTVVDEITNPGNPGWPEGFDELGVGGISYFAPNRLLVANFNDNSLWTMDFSGNILSGPVTPSGATAMGEGVVQTSDGRVVSLSYPQSLLFFDSSLNRVPASDRSDTVGLNLNLPSGIGWNSDTNTLLIAHDTNLSVNTPRISAVPVTLDSSTPIVDLSDYPQARKVKYLPDENLIAVLKSGPAGSRAILLFNTVGALIDQISLPETILGINPGGPVNLAYRPVADEFIVGFNGAGVPEEANAERRRLRVFSREGVLVDTLDLTATGTGGVNGLEYFESTSGTGRLRILGSAGRVITTDLTGNSRNSDGVLLGEFNSRAKLGLVGRNDIAAITSGPLAGSFAMIDNSAGEIVIFR